MGSTADPRILNRKLWLLWQKIVVRSSSPCLCQRAFSGVRKLLIKQVNARILLPEVRLKCGCRVSRLFRSTCSSASMSSLCLCTRGVFLLSRWSGIREIPGCRGRPSFWISGSITPLLPRLCVGIHRIYREEQSTTESLRLQVFDLVRR